MLALLLCLSILSSSVYAELQADYSWDYLQLVQQWWGTACRTRKCTIKSLDRLTLHGLWPNRNDGSWPQNCPGKKFDIRQIQSLVPQMEQYWPTYFPGTNEDFWAHEYDKHGTCAVYDDTPLFVDELSYFNLALKRTKDFPVLDTLARNGIFPSNTKNYTAAAVIDALTQNGIPPLIACKSGMLETVTYCFSKTLALQKCTGGSSKCPQGPISFPLPPNDY